MDNTADTAIYDEGARSLSAGEGYRWQGRPTAFFPIGWPLLLSGAYRLGGVRPESGQWLNVGLSLVVLAAAAGLARRQRGPGAAAWTVLVLSLMPHQVIFPAFLMSEVAFTAFFMASLWLASDGTRSLARLAAAGLLMGAATLIRGPALLFPLAILAMGLWGERQSFGRSLAAAVVFGAALLVPLAPWSARNHHVFGRWVLVANDGGMNFLMGNHPGATGARHEPEGGLPDTGDEVADDREGYRRGLAFIRSRPLEFVSLIPRKLVRLAAPAPLLTYRAELLSKWPRPLALALLILDQIIHLAVWILAALTLLEALAERRGAGGRASRERAATVLSLSALGLWLLIHALYLGGARYFFPVAPVLAAVACGRLAGPGRQR